MLHDGRRNVRSGVARVSQLLCQSSLEGKVGDRGEQGQEEGQVKRGVGLREGRGKAEVEGGLWKSAEDPSLLTQQGWLPGRACVEEAFRLRDMLAPNTGGRVLVIGDRSPWREHLFDIEEVCALAFLLPIHSSPFDRSNIRKKPSFTLLHKIQLVGSLSLIFLLIAMHLLLKDGQRLVSRRSFALFKAR